MSVQLTPVEKKQRKRFTAKHKVELLREWEETFECSEGLPTGKSFR